MLSIYKVNVAITSLENTENLVDSFTDVIFSVSNSYYTTIS